MAMHEKSMMARDLVHVSTCSLEDQLYLIATEVTLRYQKEVAKVCCCCCCVCVGGIGAVKPV